MTNGIRKVFATAAGSIWEYIIDQAAQRVPVRMSAMFVPELGRNVSSFVKALQSEIILILETATLHLQLDNNTPLPLSQHPEDKSVCSGEGCIRTLGGTADTPSPIAVAFAAPLSADAKQRECALTEIQQSCSNSIIAMEYTTPVTLQQKGASERYEQNVTPKSECTPTGGNNTPEEAAVTETECQSRQLPHITTDEGTVTETDRFCAPVQVMAHYYENTERGEAIDNSRSVLDGNWSIPIRRTSIVMTRD